MDLKLSALHIKDELDQSFDVDLLVIVEREVARPYVDPAAGVFSASNGIT
ncbi:MAG: hypothetical protein M3410_00035 [Acidobacteriota bacterium]|nr:hypothetical protein [Acidobacteriota bacterium]